MIALVILVIVNIMIFMRVGRALPKDGKKWTVYGTMGCGWTRKQLEYMKNQNIPHTFIDCDEESCAGMDAFPTLVDPNGKQLVGYNEV
ncbi:hypothetical protein MPWG_00103 [Micromonas pusilla virus PL1]|nr:hypothetical protein MPWG_00103 [Micromonas pusilla virus PL1]